MVNTLQNIDERDASSMKGEASHRLRNLTVLAIVVIVWLALDQLTKAWFNQLSVGSVTLSPIPQAIDFVLVHNTGAAWGVFSNATSILAVVSVVVCIIVVVYLFASPNASLGTTIGLSLVVAGGIGNAIDRIANGYVIDFISFSFIDFPVFNIADIGVTCGLTIFIISFIWDWTHSCRDDSKDGVSDTEA